MARFEPGTVDPVAYPTGCSMEQAGVSLFLAGVWLSSVVVWWQAHGWTVVDMSIAWWGFLGTGSVLACLTWRRLKRSVGGQLVWEDGEWRLFTPLWQRGLRITRVECVVDIDAWLVLRVHTRVGLTTWVWCRRSERPQTWVTFRQALYGAPESDGL